jgi:hypothetical protein
MIQSIEFITDGFVTAAVDVSDYDIAAHYEANREDYYIKPFVTFTHVFFDAERRSRDESLALATAKLGMLNSQQVPFSDAMRHATVIASRFSSTMSSVIHSATNRLVTR